MIADIRDYLIKFFSSRLFVLSAIMVFFFTVILFHVFHLQIIRGASYEENFETYSERTITIDAARGNIYDCNGVLLAGNELAYSVLLSDSGTYARGTKNELLNAEIATILDVFHANGEKLNNTFSVDYDPKADTYSYNVSGNALKRFLADVFGQASYDSLKYNEDFGFDEAKATASQVVDYLRHDAKGGYMVSDSYSEQTAYEIVVVRYALSAYSFSRYQSIILAENASEATVAYMNEHSDTLTGISISEDTIRRYYGGESIAPLIGYTGKISDEEYKKLHESDESYTTNDIIGKAGLEQYYEGYLRGENGEEEVYVNNVGKISEVISRRDSKAGCDLTTTIDLDLQKGTYYLLEQEIAGIVYAKIREHEIEIEDVYYALINNQVIDSTHFAEEDAGKYERVVYEIFEPELTRALGRMRAELETENPQTNENMSDELLDDFTYVMTMLRNNNVLLSDQIDTADETYILWRDGKLAPQTYLNYCIAQQWIDISALHVSEKYSDTSEVYTSLCDYIIEQAGSDKSFAKIVYKYLIASGSVTGRQLCLILFEQGILDYDDEVYHKLDTGVTSPYDFMLQKINKIEITPAQLALDPCTGSCILTDVNTGKIKALVSYPGYDNNKMANGVDADYFAKLQEDLSNPQYNYATQERTAPGSTFKMVTSTAGLADGAISTESLIQCTGVFEEVDNKPKCWIYPSTHKTINVSQALRDSCNVFFYTVGYRLSMKRSSYDDATGIGKLKKYASIYGLNKKSGLEIEENTSELADEYPVMAAIGQSNHNITTAALSRYVTAVATGKLYEYRLMDRITDTEGNVIETHDGSYTDIRATLTTEQWDAVHSGMRMVCEELDCFDGFDIHTAGKTGTAQQVETRPNHALFLGYAPYEHPKVSVAVRIAYGYSSHNAAAAAQTILKYYFGETKLSDILSVNADGANASTSSQTTD